MKRFILITLAAILALAAPAWASDVLVIDLTSYQSMKEFALSLPTTASGATVEAKTDSAIQTHHGSDTGTVLFDLAAFRSNTAALQITGVSAYETAHVDLWGGVSVYWQETMVDDAWAWSGATLYPVIEEEVGTAVTDYVVFPVDGVKYGRLRIQFLSAVSEFTGVLRVFKKTE